MNTLGLQVGEDEALVQKTLLFTGYAKLPLTLTASKLYEVIVVAVIVDPDTSEILDVDCTLATAVGRNFFKGLVQGYHLDEGIEGLEAILESRYYGSARRSLIQCLHNIYNRFLAYKNQVTIRKLD